jgi:hypothetical protein
MVIPWTHTLSEEGDFMTTRTVMTQLSADLRRLVIERASERCEYYLFHQADPALFDHEVDHLIAEKYMRVKRQKGG